MNRSRSWVALGGRPRGTMALFLDILTKVTLPIITLVALGYMLQSRLKLDIGTLNRVQVYVVMPAFLVHFLATGKQPIAVVWPVFYFGIVQFLILIPIGWLAVILLRQRASLGPMMGLGTAYANVGFFGIPVTQLAFGADYLIYQSVMTALMSVLVCTVGVWLLAPSGKGSGFSKLKTAFETPLIPSVILGLCIRGFEVEMPTVVAQPMQFLGSIFTPLALYTLGAQVAASKVLKIEWIPQILILFLKFIFAPVLTWWICRFMEFPRDVADLLVVAAATPVGVLITIFAAEYKNESEFISTAVVISTALSPLFVTGWILVTRLY
jgi:malate permease and related proteins